MAQPNGVVLICHNFSVIQRQGGAVLIDHLEIANIDVSLNATFSGEGTALLAEFKLSLNAYLKDLVSSPVRSLADVIAFNEKFSDLVSRKILKLLSISLKKKKIINYVTMNVIGFTLTP